MPEQFTHDAIAVQQAKVVADLQSLLAFDDAEFVAAAYLTLLRRPVDGDGLVHYTRKLRAGYTQIEIVALISQSREGRSKGVELPGMARALRRYRLSRLPLLGRLFRLLANGEGHSARDRCLRAIERGQLRQERAAALHHEQLIQTLKELGQGLAAGSPGDGPALAGADQLIVQPRGQTPSILSRFIQLERTVAEEVIVELSALVRVSHEAEQLAAGRN